MKTVLLLGGSLNGHRREVHGVMNTVMTDHSETYRVVPMCSHGEVHWFGVLDGADPLALLIAGYAPAAPMPRFDPALIDMAAYHDERASAHLDATGSFAWFDEPAAVQSARAALGALGFKP